ncbi:MAG TPA: hydroxymethylbilane synthase [Caldimonas sp.]|nr:hydroxymethylbilane synthase [Caldimonas sp.]
MTTLRLGTRGSQLALWQANTVKQRIAESGGPHCEIVVIKTSGDRQQDAPLSEIGGKRLFVKEIEDALLRDDIDLAVHSSKDMPALLPAGLVIAGVLPREDPLDEIVLPVRAEGRGQRAEPASVGDLVKMLGETPSIGTSSVRRIAQLTRLFPGARFTPIRGNLDTRLRKLDEGQHDAIVLAAAGLRRLGFASRISMTFPADACVPAPGQGIVAIEIRDGDEDTRRAVARIEDAAAAAALAAERAVVERLGGGCQTPIGALATMTGDGQLELMGAVVALDGSRAVRARARGPREDAVTLGVSVGDQLLAEGAADILADAQRAQTPVDGIQP